MAKFNRKRKVSTYGKGFVAAARGAYKIARRVQRTRQLLRPRIGSATPLTSQHDTRLVYRKKSMPRRQRARWVNFKRKVTAVEYGNLNLNNVTMVQIQYCNATMNRTSFTAAMIYGINGSPGSPGDIPPFGVSGTASMDDVFDVLSNKYAVGGTAMNGRRFLFGSACMDIHATNIGDSTLILEAYEIYAKQTYTPTLTSYDGPEDIFTQGLGLDYQVMPNTPQTPSALRLGTNPFNCKLFSQYFTVKSKRRIQVTPGELVSFQMRDPRNYFISGNNLGRPNVGWKKGQCKGYFFQIYGQPTVDLPSQTEKTLSAACSLKFTIIKSYSFKQVASEPVQYGHVEEN